MKVGTKAVSWGKNILLILRLIAGTYIHLCQKIGNARNDVRMNFPFSFH